MQTERKFTLEYWKDDGWYVGQLLEVPNVFSQGKSLKELERNILEAYALVMRENRARVRNIRAKKHQVEIVI